MIYELNPEKIIYPYLVKVRADSARKTIRRLTRSQFLWRAISENSVRKIAA
jgi:hypothetical protein